MRLWMQSQEGCGASLPSLFADHVQNRPVPPAYMLMRPCQKREKKEKKKVEGREQQQQQQQNVNTMPKFDDMETRCLVSISGSPTASSSPPAPSSSWPVLFSDAFLSYQGCGDGGACVCNRGIPSHQYQDCHRDSVMHLLSEDHVRRHSMHEHASDKVLHHMLADQIYSNKVPCGMRRCRFLRRIQFGLQFLGSAYLHLLFMIAFQGAISSCTSAFDDSGGGDDEDVDADVEDGDVEHDPQEEEDDAALL